MGRYPAERFVWALHMLRPSPDSLPPAGLPPPALRPQQLSACAAVRTGQPHRRTFQQQRGGPGVRNHTAHPRPRLLAPHQPQLPAPAAGRCGSVPSRCCGPRAARLQLAGRQGGGLDREGGVCRARWLGCQQPRLPGVAQWWSLAFWGRPGCTELSPNAPHPVCASTQHAIPQAMGVDPAAANLPPPT